MPPLSTALWYSCVCVLQKLREMVFERYSVNAGESWHGARTQLQDSVLLPSFSEMFLKKEEGNDICHLFSEENTL